jgi:preprotein translocase subunit SecD
MSELLPRRGTVGAALLSVVILAASGCAGSSGVGPGEPVAGSRATDRATATEPRLAMFVAREVDPRAPGATGRLHPLEGTGVLALEATPILTGHDVISVDWDRTNSGEPLLEIELSPPAAARVLAATTAPDGLWFAIVWDNGVISAPRIMGTLSHRLAIMGDPATLEEIAGWLADDRAG